MNVTHLECARCQTTYDHNKPEQLCTQCGSPLYVRYDLKKVNRQLTKDMLIGRKNNLWRYWELLPIEKEKNVINLGEGMTPLLSLSGLGHKIGLPNLYLKDEGLNPTGSFKARGAAVGVSRAKELGVQVLVMPTAGNAGGAWSSYCTAVGIEAVVVMPADAQGINMRECIITGASLYLVKGILNDAGKVVARAVDRFGWYDASTLKEPYRIEGKKTMGLEIAEQLGWQLPDVILYPTGGGVGIIAIYKALTELKEMGWIDGDLPRLVAVQSSLCAPVPKAWEERKTECEYWSEPNTSIPGLCVPKALGDFMVLDAIYKTDGCAVAVDDEDAYAAQRELAATQGLFVCPEGASTLAAATKLTEEGWIKPKETVVLLNTGSGLKYPETVNVDVPVLALSDDLADNQRSWRSHG